MVAFAGHRYAARFMNSERGGCKTCNGREMAVHLAEANQTLSASTINTVPSELTAVGTVDCSIGIQLAFSGIDKHESVFNSWYEVQNLRQYSLYGLYSNLRDSLTSQYNRFF